MQIQLIRSATLRITTPDLTILVDPWLAGAGDGRSYAGLRCSPLVDLPMPAERVVAGIDVVLVSHLHSDHLDEPARAALGPAVPVIAHARNVHALRDLGFADVRPVGTGLDLGPVRITTTSRVI